MAVLTAREQAMAWLANSFVGMVTGQSVYDPYTIQFDYVHRSPLDEDSLMRPGGSMTFARQRLSSTEGAEI